MAGLTGLEGQCCGVGLRNGALREPLRSTAPLVDVTPWLTFLELLYCL